MIPRIIPIAAAFLLIIMFGQSVAVGQDAQPTSTVARQVGPVPQTLRDRLKLDPFYQQYVDVGGLPIVGSAKVSPFAMLEAAYLVDQMLSHRPDVLKALGENRVRLTVMAATEYTTDVPEHSDLTPKAYWDKRARGLGATPQRPSVSCAEENLLGLRGDPYSTENIMIHEFAHAVHEMGMSTVDPTFDGQLQAAFKDATAKGLWKGKYAGTNRAEYFAEGVQSWFDTNRENDNEHNHVNTREELKEYDPALAKLVEEVYGDREWRYVHPSKRKELGHLKGFDVNARPAFKWQTDAASPDEKNGTTESRRHTVRRRRDEPPGKREGLTPKKPAIALRIRDPQTSLRVRSSVLSLSVPP